MKLLYALCLLLLQFPVFSTGTVQAAAPAKLEQRPKKAVFTAVISQHDELADIAQPVYIKSCKSRDHRFVTPGPFEKQVQVPAHYCGRLYSFSHLCSFHTLLTRLLLFPRHYFW